MQAFHGLQTFSIYSTVKLPVDVLVKVVHGNCVEVGWVVHAPHIPEHFL